MWSQTPPKLCPPARPVNYPGEKPAEVIATDIIFHLYRQYTTCTVSCIVKVITPLVEAMGN